MTGIPCVDWSPAGARARYNGTTMRLLHAFVLIHMQNDTPLVIVEEVPDLSRTALPDSALPDRIKCEVAVESFGRRSLS